MDLLSIPYNEEQKQLTIIDLSRIPSEITPIIIGMLSRICFEFKLWEQDPQNYLYIWYLKRRIIIYHGRLLPY